MRGGAPPAAEQAPGHTPGLGEMLTGEHGGKSFPQFLWDKLLKHGEELPGRLMKAGSDAFKGSEEFDPSAPLEVAGAVAGARVPTRGAEAAAKAVPKAAREVLTPIAKVVSDVPVAERLAAAGSSVAMGHPVMGAGIAMAPHALNAAVSGLGVAERGAGALARPLTRAGVAAGAANLLRDRDRKSQLDSDQRKTLRAATRDDAPSTTLVAANRIMQTLIPSASAQEAPQYGGTDAPGRTSSSTSGLAQQTPSPGQPSQPAQGVNPSQPQQPQQQPQQGLNPSPMMGGPLPLPGQSPGLSKLPTTGEAPIAATNQQGKTLMQFAWDHLMEGKDPKTMSKDIDAYKAKLMESGRTAFADPEHFDPSAPIKAAMTVTGMGMTGAEMGTVGALGGKLKQLDFSGMRGLAEHLTPEELEQVTTRNVGSLMEAFKGMPSADEMAAVAYSGRAKRGWYQQSAKALIDTFGNDDAPRFASLLAALSPQTSVQSNTENALRTWLNWTKAGRPTDETAIRKILGQSVQGTKGEESVLDAWIGNSLRALKADDPTKVKLSGPKVNSFMLNLRNHVHEVTNDAWMARYARVPQEQFASRRIKDPYFPELSKEGKYGVKSPGYMAMSAATRRAASRLSKLTGDTWTPAEIQETIWSWAKTLREKATSKEHQTTVSKLLKAGNITHAEIADTPDFALLFTRGVYRKILEEAGYGETLARVEREVGKRGSSLPGGSPTRGEGGAFAQPAFERHLQKAGRRLDQPLAGEE